MSGIPAGAMGGGAGAMAAMANAIKASGAIVSVEASDFETILRKVDRPLVVRSEGGIFSTKYKYLTAYKGLVFYTKTGIPLSLAADTEVVDAKRIYIPEM